MITNRRLKELLKKIPDDAMIFAYEGEEVGISISYMNKFWWIQARDNDELDEHIEGFDDQQT